MIENILFAVMWFAVLGAAMGLLLAIASKIFFVKTEEKVAEISELLPGANCGGCGYAGCSALAEAIANGEAKTSACVAGDEMLAAKLAEIMGVPAEKPIRMRAQVMCSGTSEYAKKKYIYKGAKDCFAASKMSGGDKLCPNGCTGLGTCVKACKFDAINIVNGVAVVDYEKCQACGRCVEACPKQIIRLIPYESKHWVGCMSVDKGAVTRAYCSVGCISCHLCEKACKHDAIHVSGGVASIDYEKCVECGDCVAKCPRKIIWSDRTQRVSAVIKPEDVKDI